MSVDSAVRMARYALSLCLVPEKERENVNRLGIFRLKRNFFFVGGKSKKIALRVWIKNRKFMRNVRTSSFGNNGGLVICNNYCNLRNFILSELFSSSLGSINDSGYFFNFYV